MLQRQVAVSSSARDVIGREKERGGREECTPVISSGLNALLH